MPMPAIDELQDNGIGMWSELFNLCKFGTETKVFSFKVFVLCCMGNIKHEKGSDCLLSEPYTMSDTFCA